MATINNRQFSSVNKKWEDGEFSWNKARGTWSNPYNFTNLGANTANLTNRELSQIKVGDATFEVGDAIGLVLRPYGVNNKEYSD